MKTQFLTYLFLGYLLTTSSVASDTNHGSDNSQTGIWKAFIEMKAGNKRFVEGKPMHGNQDKKTREQLAKGQKPHTIVLSCSDSRVPPELIFDQGLGQIFTVRVAGEVLDASTVASMEYAVEHLGAKLLVVLGHEACGAVKAALTTPKGQSAGSADLDALVAAIQPNVEKYRAPAGADPMLRGPVKANVSGVVKNLMQRSKIIREAIEKDRLLVAEGIYALQSGQVEFTDVGHPSLKQ